MINTGRSRNSVLLAHRFLSTGGFWRGGTNGTMSRTINNVNPFKLKFIPKTVPAAADSVSPDSQRPGKKPFKFIVSNQSKSSKASKSPKWSSYAFPSRETIKSHEAVSYTHLDVYKRQALERLIFPENTPGFNIDAIARQFLWSRGLDYKHGTGHGIGSFLNVHEGPMGVGFRPHLMNFPLRAGNIISNEPGYYKDGEYGIRIESDMLIKKATEKGNFLKFENMTVVPYCRKLINTKLLNEEEKTQINEYHARVWRTIVHFLQPQSISYKWLKRETSPL